MIRLRRGRRNPVRTGPPAPDEILTWRRPPGFDHGGEAEETRRCARRVLWIGRVAVCTLTVIFLGLLGRVAQLQTRPLQGVTERLDAQISPATIQARRAEILDRHGRPLAVSRVAHRLFIDPRLIADRNTFAEDVGYRLGYDPAWIEQTLDRRADSRYIILDHRLDPHRLAAIAGLDLAGLATEPVLVRDYPHGTAAGQLIGFIGRDGIGLDGIERAWNRRLTATDGGYRFVRDARRRPLWMQAGTYRAHTDAPAVRLSLDLTIQTLAERVLSETVAHHRADSGIMIIMDPVTGEIIAMANVPLFDPNTFATAAADTRRNRAVTDVFEPGSIFKAIVWAALTDAGAAGPDRMIDTTTSGHWKPKRGPRLRDAHPHGQIDWSTVLVQSSNIGMAKVAEEVGITRLHRMIAAYGIGSPTGSGLPGEISGHLRQPRAWSATDLTRIPMGQGVSVTGLQMMRAFCVLANGGHLIQPTLEATGPGAAPPPPTRVLSPATAQLTRQVLGRAVTEGTGRKARSDLYDLFGKTGTAQLPDLEQGGYHQDRYVSSFIAGAPLDAPRLVIGCFIRNPDKTIGHYGGTVAAPAVRQVMEQALRYLGVPARDQAPAPGRLVHARP